MGNEFKSLAAHSADWFGEPRDHWWNEDSLGFLASKWHLNSVRTVLDVGCGVGHWGRLLCRLLPRESQLTGIDREPVWIAKAVERAAAAGLSDRLRYQVGVAEKLPFDDGTFDLVTCQTLLMHLPAPGQGLAEMIRVTRPGGMILVAEPTNLLGPALLDAVALGEPPETAAALLRFQLICQRGKAKVREGDELIDERLRALFASAGLQEVEMRLNDRMHPMEPAYNSAAARALTENVAELAGRSIWIWNRDDTRRYFAAGGGEGGEFEACWASALAFQQRVADAISARRYTCAGGGLFYVIWGRKPPAPRNQPN